MRLNISFRSGPGTARSSGSSTPHRRGRPDRLRHDWTVDDPSIATVTGDGPSGDIQPKATGATTAHITAVGRSGQVVSDARIDVREVPAQPGSGPARNGDLKPTP